MNIIVRCISISAVTLLSACASFFPSPVQIGDSEAALIEKRGEPTHRYKDGNTDLLEYATGPWGQRTYMARLGPDGKVASFEQVLTMEKFATIKVGEANKDAVLRTIGAPSDTSALPLRDLEVWTYPYKESDVWNSMMHVHFDRDGIVRQMLNGPDPRYDANDSRSPFLPRMR
jgi:hypothetical protein